MNVDFPRMIWQEADTYRIATKQSESTIHTITKRNLEQIDFEYPIFEVTLEQINLLIEEWRNLENAKDKKEVFLRIKNNLPEGFLQRRIWCMSYKTFQNMYHQRIGHKMPQWKEFLEIILSQLEHPEFIVKSKE